MTNLLGFFIITIILIFLTTVMYSFRCFVQQCNKIGDFIQLETMTSDELAEWDNDAYSSI